MIRTDDPGLTLEWLNAPKPLATKRFVVEAGQIRYTQWMQSSKTHKRLAYIATAACELTGCGASSASATLVYDHCHRHGWVRAVLCNSHNIRIAHLEAAWLEHGVDLSPTPYWQILMGCGHCRDGREPEPAVRDEPKYQQFVEMIRDQIRRGELLPGAQLPSNTKYKADGWRHGTYVSAMRQLRREGWVRGQPGEATFVADDPPLAT